MAEPIAERILTLRTPAGVSDVPVRLFALVRGARPGRMTSPPSVPLF